MRAFPRTTQSMNNSMLRFISRPGNAPALKLSRITIGYRMSCMQDQITASRHQGHVIWPIRSGALTSILTLDCLQAYLFIFFSTFSVRKLKREMVTERKFKVLSVLVCLELEKDSVDGELKSACSASQLIL